MFTSLMSDSAEPLADTQIAVSSLMDTWLLLGNHERGAERVRTIQIVKARGMAHSNQVRDFVFSSRGLQFGPPRPQSPAAPRSRRIPKAAR